MFIGFDIVDVVIEPSLTKFSRAVKFTCVGCDLGRGCAGCGAGDAGNGGGVESVGCWAGDAGALFVLGLCGGEGLTLMDYH